MFAHVAINHSTCCFIYLEKYKEMRGDGRLKTFAQYCIPQTSLMGSHLLLNVWTSLKFLLAFKGSFFKGPPEDSPPLTLIASQVQATTLVSRSSKAKAVFAFSRKKLMSPSILSAAQSSLSLPKEVRSKHVPFFKSCNSFKIASRSYWNWSRLFQAAQSKKRTSKRNKKNYVLSAARLFNDFFSSCV